MIPVPSGIDPQAWLADVLSRIAGRPASRLDELLLCNWTSPAACKPELTADYLFPVINRSSAAERPLGSAGR